MKARLKETVYLSPDDPASSLHLAPTQIRPVVQVNGDRVVLNVYEGSIADDTVETDLANVELMHDDELLVRFLVHPCGGGATARYVMEQGGFGSAEIIAAVQRGHVLVWSHEHGQATAETGFAFVDDWDGWDVSLPDSLYNQQHGVLRVTRDTEGRVLPLE